MIYEQFLADLTADYQPGFYRAFPYLFGHSILIKTPCYFVKNVFRRPREIICCMFYAMRNIVEFLEMLIENPGIIVEFFS